MTPQTSKDTKEQYTKVSQKWTKGESKHDNGKEDYPATPNFKLCQEEEEIIQSNSITLPIENIAFPEIFNEIEIIQYLKLS